MTNENKQSNDYKNNPANLKAMNIEKEKFIQVMNVQQSALKQLVKQGRGITIRQRDVIINDMRYNLYHAWISKTINGKIYSELQDIMRDIFSWDSLIGFKQLSLFDEIPNEYFKNEENK